MVQKWCKLLHISKFFRTFAPDFEKAQIMDNKEFLERLLILAEKQQENIEDLRKIVKKQQRTIDALTKKAQPILNIDIDMSQNKRECSGNNSFYSEGANQQPKLN